MREFTQSWRSGGSNVALPLHWRKSRRIRLAFDLFDDHDDETIDKIFAVMALCPQHTFQVLTKRAERMRAYMLTENRCHMIGDQMLRLATIRTGFRCVEWPFKNVWLGVSCERQQEADERIPLLLQTPAAVRFISAEPLLGAIDLRRLPFTNGDPRHKQDALTGEALMYGEGVNGHPDVTVRINDPLLPKLDWVIVGGESGPKARPMHPQWARDIRDQCSAAGVAFFFKQWGRWLPMDQVDADAPSLARRKSLQVFEGQYNDYHSRAYDLGKKAAGRLLDGREHNEFPKTEPASVTYSSVNQSGLPSHESKNREAIR